MSSLVKRKCNSDKSCTDCGAKIPLGELYYGGSYKSLCVPCGEKEESITVEDVVNPKPKVDSYANKKCEFCGDAARGNMDGKLVCPKQDCIDKAFGLHSKVI